jgi:hypothetical protein
MIEQLDHDRDDVLGFRVVGDVTRDDYAALTPVVEGAVEEHGTIRLLLDMHDFTWEHVGAWGADLHFGRQFHEAVERLALVGDQRWGRHLAHLAGPFYAQRAEWFEDRDTAWSWVTA